MSRAPWTLIATVLAACAGPGTPIPVRGDVEPLVGQWQGEYSSPATGRVGSIVFTLRAGTDTARGDILMVPANMEAPVAIPRDADPTRRPPQLLHVSFVRCEGSAVSGWIDPYTDPDTGERVLTTFDGFLAGETITGTFVSYAELSNRRTTGTWTVTRKGPPPPE